MPREGALTKGLDWQQWWGYWWPRCPERQPWVAFVGDAIGKLHEGGVRMARVLRQGAPWESRGFTEAEWTDQAAQAEAALAWFRQHRGTLSGVPDWARVLLEGLEGCFTMQVRHAKELMALKRQGYSVVNVSPLAKDLLQAPPREGIEDDH